MPLIMPHFRLYACTCTSEREKCMRRGSKGYENMTIYACDTMPNNFDILSWYKKYYINTSIILTQRTRWNTASTRLSSIMLTQLTTPPNQILCISFLDRSHHTRPLASSPSLIRQAGVSRGGEVKLLQVPVTGKWMARDKKLIRPAMLTACLLW